MADWYPGFDIPGMRDDIPALYRIIGERDGQPGVYHSRWVEANHIGTTIDGNITDFADSFIIGENGSITVSDLNGVSDTYYIVPGAIGCIVSCTPDQIFATITEGGVTYTPFDGTEPIYDNGSNPFILSAMEATHGDVINFHYYDTISPARNFTSIIDGSVTNVISGVTEATAIAGTAGAILVQEVEVGNIATTVLGAVNTGDIAVGVNSSANEATSAASRALTASMSVVGGSADTGSMMLNISHNSSVINGSVSNMLVAVNGSVGNIATTTLGAVNTGTISSGVFSAVQGIVGISD